MTPVGSKYRWNVVGIAAIIVCSVVGCRTIPTELPPLPESSALEPSTRGPLCEFARAHSTDTLSGAIALDTARDALNWRLALVDSAQESLDIQYFLWRQDESGKLFLYRILRAADRGVRVRLLMDDFFFLRGDDEALAVALDRHPKIQVRLFNPWRRRGPAYRLEYALNKQRHHRMHNKALIADGVAAIVGGRNIGDVYFGLSGDVINHDFDVLTVGPVVPQVSEGFDYYWNNDLVVSGETLAEALSNDTFLLDGLRLLLADWKDTWDNEFISLEPQEWNEMLHRASESVRFVDGDVAYDEISNGSQNRVTYRRMQELLLEANEEILIVSAYFVPNPVFLEAVRLATERGIRVVILTNSLASNNHVLVHAGYEAGRKDLLKAGAELYEFRWKPALLDDELFPSSEATRAVLHRKIAVVDRSVTFVGSFNFNPRSMHLDSETGLVLVGEEFAQELARQTERDISPANAWRITLNSEQRVVWHSDAGTRSHDPARSWWHRFVALMASFAPVRDQI